MMENKVLAIHDTDNVGVMLADVCKGEKLMIAGSETTAKEDIKFGFKIALKDLKKGEHIVKYGWNIGIANRDIEKGEMVHIHNIEGLLGNE